MLTFDNYGVSGHPNHIATYNGVLRACQMNFQATKPPVYLYTLESVGIVRKYIGVLDIAVTSLLSLFSRERSSVTLHHNWSNAVPPLAQVLTKTSSYSKMINVCHSAAPLTSHSLMVAHDSQYVWFRCLFVIFSRYAYINTLILVTPVE